MASFVRLQAQVKMYKADKGYGYITNDIIRLYKKDIFFHVNDFEDSNVSLEMGDTIEFELEHADKGIKAVRCVKLEKEQQQ